MNTEKYKLFIDEIQKLVGFGEITIADYGYEKTVRVYLTYLVVKKDEFLPSREAGWQSLTPAEGYYTVEHGYKKTECIIVPVLREEFKWGYEIHPDSILALSHAQLGKLILALAILERGGTCNKLPPDYRLTKRGKNLCKFIASEFLQFYKSNPLKSGESILSRK